jgi:hypothetical protein
LNKIVKLGETKKILLMFFILLCFKGNSVLASDNVLQAIQINGVKDSYNIILKSDDIAEIKKTIQAPNKMILNLKGIRASKTINTIYNNTSKVDSVVVEPINDETVKLLIQADNVQNAGVHFDTLKTPLGVLGNSENKVRNVDEIVLSKPIESYKPVYTEDNIEKDTNSLNGVSVATVKYLKKALKNDKLDLLIIFGFFTIFFLAGVKLIKGKDNEIKIGLSQSLKDREIDLYKRGLDINSQPHFNISDLNHMTSNATPRISAGMNYGLRAYQNGTKSPYASPERLNYRPSAASTPVAPANLQKLAQEIIAKQTAQATMQKSTLKTAPANTKPKIANIDSMKFLESMTKIYEKNGRTDLAQGLKSNMKKAKMNLA